MAVRSELVVARWIFGVLIVVLLTGYELRLGEDLDVIAEVLIVVWIVVEALDSAATWWNRRVAGWKREGVCGLVWRASRFWHEARRAWRDGSR